MLNGTNLRSTSRGWVDKAFGSLNYRRKQFFITLNFQKMKTKKMSLADVKDKLSRAEMKNIMAGTAPGGGKCGDFCNSSDDCPDSHCGLCESKDDGPYVCNS